MNDKYKKMKMTVLYPKMKIVNDNMISFMHSLSHDNIPTDMTIKQMQKEINDLISLHSQYDNGTDDVPLRHYMVAIRVLISILSETKR